MPRTPRPPRSTLPGIADVRIAADAATTARVVAALAAEFRSTDPRTALNGCTYLQLDTGSTDPDPD
ncbi:hypothetical protein ACIOHE_39185 [Streptomyces sp. NPDC087851]|uniref:hypothetical protein n=1 Tax=Streptomyces sp. NPDC087851 TaxID=3365810 RepID=UPI0038073815